MPSFAKSLPRFKRQARQARQVCVCRVDVQAGGVYQLRKRLFSLAAAAG